jgi:hypothetical protein
VTKGAMRLAVDNSPWRPDTRMDIQTRVTSAGAWGAAERESTAATEPSHEHSSVDAECSLDVGIAES